MIFFLCVCVWGGGVLVPLRSQHSYATGSNIEVVFCITRCFLSKLDEYMGWILIGASSLIGENLVMLQFSNGSWITWNLLQGQTLAINCYIIMSMVIFLWRIIVVAEWVLYLIYSFTSCILGVGLVLLK